MNWKVLKGGNVSKKPVRVKFNIQRDGVTNGQHYPKEEFDKAMGEFKKAADEGLGFGGPGNATIALVNIGFRIKNVTINEDGTAEADVEFIDNHIGKKLSEKIEARVASEKDVYLGIRGNGKVENRHGRSVMTNLSIGGAFLVDKDSKEIMIDS